ncbi:hypothetical protein PIB30_109684, partial [Stylosanthes scabra]|nr:hypothetical protein [Stylosanthes scabra]
MHKEEQRNAGSQRGRRIPVDENKKGSTSEQRARSTKQQRKEPSKRENGRGKSNSQNLLKHALESSGGRGVMGRIQKSRKPLPRPLLSFATSPKKDETSPLKRVDHKETRSSRNLSERKSPHG